MELRERLAHWLAGDYIRREMKRRSETALAALEDAFAWTNGTTTSEQDLSWAARAENLDDALAAWAENPFARRIVNLHTSHVVGRNLSIGHTDPRIAAWVRRFWHHRKNRINLEIYDWCDELCRAGELFFVLFTNPADGMQYVRVLPARRIVAIESDPDDYKRELVYHEQVTAGVQGHAPLPDTKIWLSPEHPDAAGDPSQPVMLHYAVNRPAGAVRSYGGDLDPLLPWIRRYNDWLKDRVRLNKYRSSWAWKMTAADEARVTELERRYRGGLVAGSVWVGTKEEDLGTVSAQVDASDAKEDGRAIRQAIAVGGNVPLHMLGDTDGATRATAREANGPTFQWWTMRQIAFVAWMKDLAETAVRRAHATGKSGLGRHLPRTLSEGWTHELSDLTREDNLALAEAAHLMVRALATMAEQGWIDPATAITWAAKFAGEQLDAELILQKVHEPPPSSEAAEAVAQRRAGGSISYPAPAGGSTAFHPRLPPERSSG
ncbi:MAG: hypothetical protein ACRDIB_01500, partial [Ardenticatenaceae bacterium]